MEMPKRSKSSSRCTESESEVLKSKGESMKMMTPLRGFDLLHRGLRDSWRSIAMAWAVCLSVSMLGGCGVIPPNVLTTPGNPVPVGEVFPRRYWRNPSSCVRDTPTPRSHFGSRIPESVGLLRLGLYEPMKP